MKVLITGASTGIGRDMARELSQKGYDLVLVARDYDKLNEVKQEFGSLYPIMFADPLPLGIACHIGPGALAITCCLVDNEIVKNYNN